MNIRDLLRSLVLASMPLLLSPAWADTATNYNGPRWSYLDTKKILDAAADITTANYPDSDSATVEKKMVRVYRADGTGECQDETYTKVLTEKGKRGNRSLRLDYMLPYSTAEAVVIEVIKPGGKVSTVDIAANKKEAIDDSQMGMNIYDPNAKILNVNIPGVEIGDVVHTITRTTIHRSYIPGEYAEDNLFEGSEYIRHTSYDVYAPADKPLKKMILRDEVPGTVKHTTEKEKGGTHHRWEVTNVPRMFDEPAMPPYEQVLQRLIISTTPDWQAVSKWYAGVCQPHLEATTPEMKKTVADLIAKETDSTNKIKAVFHHVSNKIRYMGLTPEQDRPGFEPHDVKLTFENKYGVCRDKAALLVAMLRAAGFKSYPVLINVGAKKDSDVAEPFFNHAIVGVEVKPREYVLMDPTAENTKDLLPSYECDLSYLVCRPDGENIKTSPIVPAEQNMMRVKTTATLSAAGSLKGRSEMVFEGINDTEYREMFSRMKPDDKQRFFEAVLKRAMPGAKLISHKLIPEDMLDTSTGVRATLEFSAEGMTASGDGKAVVNLPWMGKHFGIVSFILGGTGLEKRKYPLRTYIACGLKEDMTVQLEGFESAISLPTYPPISDETMSYARNTQAKGNALECSGEFKMKVVQFSPKQYAKLKGTLKALDYDERKAPVMAVANRGPATTVARADSGSAPKVESNAKVLESHKELEITDAHSQIYKMRYAKEILNYSGKKNEAEVKIGFNPACEDAKFVKGVVISKTGQKQLIATNEINVMDAGWNASAKRYTGGKILVANLPGVDIGSTIEVEYQITTKNKPYLSGFESFQLFDDLEKKDVLITAPCAVPVQTILTGTAGIVTQETNTVSSTQKYHWSAQNVKALPAEPQLPPEWSYMAGVQYFAGDITSYLSELHDTMLDRSRKGAKAAEKAKQLTAEISNRLDAARAIRDFIVRSIRVAGPSFTELPLSELSAADTTFADGYGHAADRAILFHAMLTAAGFQPDFVLASSLPPIAGITNVVSSFPLPQSFQSPLVRITVDGENYYLNDTDQYSKLGSTSHDGRLAFVLPNRTCEIVHAAKGCEDKTDTTYTLSLSDNGKTRVGITRQYYGQHYNGKNRYFSELPPEERKRYFQEIVSEVAQGAKPIGDLKTKFDTYPGLEQYTVEVDNYSVVDGKYSYFDLPFTPSMFSFGADHRTLPLYISWQGENTVRTEIELPPAFKRVDIAPKSQELTAPGGGGSARIASKDEGAKRVITHDFDTTPAIISPKDYASLLNLEATLGQKSSKTFLIEK
jgi:transglutaminase-like putative cysteine protease